MPVVVVVDVVVFFNVHLPCEKNDRLDCQEFPSCSSVQTQALGLGPDLCKPVELLGRLKAAVVT